jgi:hypothetical protein
MSTMFVAGTFYLKRKHTEAPQYFVKPEMRRLKQDPMNRQRSTS